MTAMSEELSGSVPTEPVPGEAAPVTDLPEEGYEEMPLLGLVPAPPDEARVSPDSGEAGPSSPDQEKSDLSLELRSLGDRLDRRLEALQTLFDREIRAEATREKVVDRLHAELQEYKQDLLLNTLRPVFIDLIQLHDDIGKVVVADLQSATEFTRLTELLEGFQQGIEDILYRQGVEPFTVEGVAFDPRRQRAVGTVPTDDPASNKTVAVRLRKGFQVGDRVIRPEVVSVFAFKP